MQQYHRLMRRRGAMLYTEAERIELLQVLHLAPGKNDAQIIDLHPKGGYRIRLDLAHDAIDAFASRLESSGWMSVV